MENNRLKKPDKKIVYLAAVIGHTFWGFSFMASRVALDKANMFVLLSHRFVMAFAILTVLVMLGTVKTNLRRKRILPVLILGMAEPVIYFLGEQYGILHSNTIFSGVMIAMIPVACTLAAAPVLKEIPSAAQIFFSVVSVGGVIGIGMMSSGAGALEPGGILGLLVAVLSAMVYTLLGRRISGEYTPFERTYVMMGLAAGVFTLMAAVYCKGSAGRYFAPLTDRGYLLAAMFLGICCSVGSFFMTAYAITYLSVAKATVFANLTTAVSVFAGAVFLKEPFSALGLVFCVMILVGIYGVQRT